MTKAGIAAVSTVVLVLLLAYYGFDFSQLGEAEDAGLVAVEEQTEGLYEIYFTDPVCGEVSAETGDIDAVIASDIDDALFSVEVAAFDVDSSVMLDALIDAEERGVEVRFVTDDAFNPVSTTNRLRRNGISVVEDKRSGLMHDKFVVLDQRVVWVGSMNFTENGVYCNNNNMVRFDAPQLALAFSAELSEMYDGREFGPTSPETHIGHIEINPLDIELNFAPETAVAPIIAREIARANQEILFLAFSFTNQDIGDAMIERAEQGLQVRGVFETIGSDQAASYYNDFRRTRLDNLEVRRDGNPRIMHHKVIILDRETTIFGSFNFTNNANDNNDETSLIVRDPEFASFFVGEFERVWAEAE